MREDRGDVGCDEKLVLSQADDGRRTGARGNDFVRIGGGKNRQGIDAAKLAHGFPHGVLQRAAFFHISLDEVGDNFGIGLGDELVAFFFELALQIHVVLDDSIVDDDYVSSAVAMRMRVFFGGAPMRGPASVADSIARHPSGIGASPLRDCAICRERGESGPFRPIRRRRCPPSHTLDIRGGAAHPESEARLSWTRCIRRFHTQFHLRTSS